MAAVAGIAVLVVLMVTYVADDDRDSWNTVGMTEMRFEPSPIEVDADDARLRVVNTGTEPHSMIIPALGRGTPDLEPGQELDVDLTGTAPGAYVVFCDVTGHREAGMETTLTLR